MHWILKNVENIFQDEENKLKRLVDVEQFTDWDEIARRLNTGRTAFQCFEHYQSKLNETKLKWTNEEDQMLKQVNQRLFVYKIGLV